jgi:hypothetical protein
MMGRSGGYTLSWSQMLSLVNRINITFSSSEFMDKVLKISFAQDDNPVNCHQAAGLYKSSIQSTAGAREKMRWDPEELLKL